MYFLIDNKNKIIFGWSAKCGCSHVKNIFWFLQNDKINNSTHTKEAMNRLPEHIENYNTVIFTRNPYKRLVSGFLDKYKKFGEFRHKWNRPSITFTSFVNELIKNKWELIERHHFTPQTSENFDAKMIRSKTIKFFDIENIDYEYIEQLYNKSIPDNVKNKKMGHERIFAINKSKKIEDYVYDRELDGIVDSDINIRYFYNEELKSKVLDFYRNDFNFFNQNGIDYINFVFE
jgi:hypothetical protein